MNKQLILLSFVATLLLSFVSCSDDDTKSTPIRSLEVTTGVDLKDRSDWILYVGSNQYNYTVENNKIIALPKSDAEMWYAGNVFWGYSDYLSGYGYAETDKYPSGNGAALYFGLVPKAAVNYPSVDNLDQSTAEKLLLSDRLAGYITTVGSENIKDAVLKHDCSLIEYITQDLPQGAEVKLMSAEHEILPYITEGCTKAIITYPNVNTIIVKIEGETYTAKIGDALATLPREQQLVRNAHITFTVKYNKDETSKDKMVTIENMKGQEWN